MTHNDLRGAAQLATQGSAGLVDLVEAMHERIARVPGLAGVLDGRTTGITGLVYKTLRGVTRVVGGTVDALLALIAPTLAAGEPAALPRPERDALVSVLNGVFGDHLDATGNPLAVSMALRRDGVALPLQPEALAARLAADGTPATATLLVMLHGLCMNDLQWQRAGQDHGARLAATLGATPLYLHYNSGLPVAENGRRFAGLMQTLLAAWPQPVQRIVLLTHSMGGLVARSALQQAAGMAWPALVQDLVFLGTPHHGAPLERAGHGVDLLLEAAPYAAPLSRLGRTRSAGITDLRHGLLGADGLPPPLPAGLRCWAVAATLGPAAEAAAPTARQGLFKRVLGHALGDGLVPLDSALGRHRLHSHRLSFVPQRQCIVADTGHLDLLSSPVVAQQLLQWFSPAPAPASDRLAGER